MQSWVELATAILSAAGLIAGALKLLARELRKAIENHGQQVRDNTQALDRLTTAIEAPIEQGPADARAALARGAGNVAEHARGPNSPQMRPHPLGLFLLPALAALALAGCTAGPDPMTLRAHDRAQEIWEQDRRADLDPELVKSRQAEFEAHKRYERSK